MYREKRKIAKLVVGCAVAALMLFVTVVPASAAGKHFPGKHYLQRSYNGKYVKAYITAFTARAKRYGAFKCIWQKKDPVDKKGPQTVAETVDKSGLAAAIEAAAGLKAED